MSRKTKYTLMQKKGMMFMYPEIKSKRHNGEENIISADGENIATLNEFWSWAYSDLMGNAERGVLAEFIVACALGIKNTIRIPWDKYDLITKEGIAVEVKASGYLQTWHQKDLSKIGFTIRPTHSWESETNSYDNNSKRQSDIYVFCVHKHTDQDTANPLIISQWDFYIMPTVLLNEKFSKQKSASLSSLMKAGAEKCEFKDLYSKIKMLFNC